MIWPTSPSLHEPIPRTVHLVWVGTAPPEWVLRRWEEWRQWGEVHGYGIRTWTNEDLTTGELPQTVAVQGELHQRGFTSPIILADFLRVEAVIREGGIYMDTDMIPMRGFDSLPQAGAWCSLLPRRRGPQKLNNGAFGAAAFHPAVTAVWDRSVANVQRGIKKVDNIAGPAPWTWVWKEMPEALQTVPVETFYPVWSDRDVRAARKLSLGELLAEFPHTLALHEFEQSWQESYTGRVD